MALKTFDRKFGAKFVSELPAKPGVYRVFDLEDQLVYVGKAKNLRRRLAQYRNAKRCRKHRKMKSIVADAARIEFDVCDTELDALLLETRLIQSHRPKWNVEGAFSFLYPMIGMKAENGAVRFCFTTKPEECEGFEWHGAYRSRFLTSEAFFGLMKLLKYVGHRVPGKARGAGSRSYVFSFRRLPEETLPQWSGFWKGETREALEKLVFALLENAGARRQKSDVEEHLKAVDRFWKHEARRLAKACKAAGYERYPVPQADRDLIFIRSRFSHEKELKP